MPPDPSRRQGRRARRESALRGPARVDARTRDLHATLKPGDIAVIDQEDLDRETAQALLARKPGAVLNASPTLTGRYPHQGARILVDAGIPLIDDLGRDIMAVKDGHELTLLGAEVRDSSGALVAEGTVQTPESVQESLTRAQSGTATRLDAFAATVADYLHRDQDVLLGVEPVADDLPSLTTRLAGRPVLIVAGGVGGARELRELQRYEREHRPVVIGVDDGAEVLHATRRRPDVALGDLGGVSVEALKRAGDVVLLSQGEDIPGRERVKALGLDHHVLPAHGTALDAAILLAADAGAQTIVIAGAAHTLDELLDAGLAETASTFLTRLRAGGVVVPASAAAHLVKPRISTAAILVLIVAALLALAGAALATGAAPLLTSLIDWPDQSTESEGST